MKKNSQKVIALLIVTFLVFGTVYSPVRAMDVENDVSVLEENTLETTDTLVDPAHETLTEQIPENSLNTDLEEGNQAGEGDIQEDGVRYILGRPMTNEERAAQDALVPSLQTQELNTDFDVEIPKDSSLARAQSTLATTYDSRDYGYITPVKQQGNWGVCWSFATQAVLEAAAIKCGLKTTADFSENHFAYFFYNRENDPKGLTSQDKTIIGTAGKNYLTIGGNTWLSAMALSGYMGAADERVSAYSGNSIPQRPAVGTAYTKNEVVLKSATFFNEKDYTGIKNAIVDNGSVAAMYIHDNKFYNQDTGAYYSNEKGTNHSITIVGWDDNYSINNFNTSYKPVNNGAWIVKNSWGREFGDQGYFYISYEDVSLNSFVTYSVQASNQYSDNTFYDGSAGLESDTIKNGGSFANVYSSETTDVQNQIVQAVQLGFASSQVQYSIQIYKDLQDISNPTSGIALFSTPVNGEMLRSGIDTVTLPQEFIPRKGSCYSVVITAAAKNAQCVRYFVEKDSNYDWVKCNTQIEKNQSFMQLSSGEQWVDNNGGVNSLTNSTLRQCARLKVLSNRKTSVQYNTSLNGMCYIQKDDGSVDVGVAYSTNDPEIQFKWQSYNLDTKKWEVISDWYNGNWMTWRPSPGNYWLHVTAKNQNGIETSYTICYAVPKATIKINGLCWIFRTNKKIDVGVAYESNDSNVQFKWQSYNLRTKEWKTVSEWYKGNWSTWNAEPGDYWLHVEAKTRDGNIATNTICFRVP